MVLWRTGRTKGDWENWKGLGVGLWGLGAPGGSGIMEHWKRDCGHWEGLGMSPEALGRSMGTGRDWEHRKWHNGGLENIMERLGME